MGYVHARITLKNPRLPALAPRIRQGNGRYGGIDAMCAGPDRNRVVAGRE